MERKIEFEMVPENMWQINLRHLLKKSEWDKIRKDVYEKAEGKCKICGKKSKRLEAHEFWEYIEDKKIQKLKEVVALCSICHKTIHIGFANALGLTDKCFKNYCKLNNCTERECIKDYNDAVLNWQKRSKIDWILDLSWLEENYNIIIEFNSK